jgi:hypothetical protein
MNVKPFQFGTFTKGLNRVVMNPQPLRELDEVSADNLGRWGTFVFGKGMAEPFLNQPSCTVGVQKEDGIWYWLIDN